MNYLNACPCGEHYPADLPKCWKCGESAQVATPAPIDPRDYAYDIETYPNCFTCRVIHIATDTRWSFEISDRINQASAFVEFVRALGSAGCRMVGFNNVHFDYPVVHHLLQNPWLTYQEIYDHAMSIIRSNDKFAYTVWDRDRLVEQIDLFKIWHFDNMAKATSLKALEFAIRMDNIEDLPFPVGTWLDDEQKDFLHVYNDHDTFATCLLYVRTLSAIRTREELSQKYGKNFMNDSDVKMGEKILVTEMEKTGIRCYDQYGKRQTIRDQISLGDVILPYIRFERPEFEAIHRALASQTITETKGGFKGLTATVYGLDYHFGTGGIHASVESQIVRSDDTMQIYDVDVASFYPNLAIANRLYPAHLGEGFCDAYLGVYKTRQTYPKTAPENGAFKLALNGAYGGSNNAYSPFLDPQYTMSITINGQLSLCMLAEQIVKIPGARMIQANTDGITYVCPREYEGHQRAIQRWWETVTGLTLEETQYDAMFIRDVNSYMAIKPGGKVKRIGAYAYERIDENPATREVLLHKDPSALVVPKAAEAVLVRGENLETFIYGHDDLHDFCLRAKVSRSAKLMLGDRQLPSIARYFVSVGGGDLVRLSPPTQPEGTWKRKPKVSDAEYYAIMSEITARPIHHPAMVDAAGTPWDARIHTAKRTKHKERRHSKCAGWLVTECNDIKRFNWLKLNYDFYIEEAKKLIDPIVNKG